MSAYSFPQTAIAQFPRGGLSGQVADSQVGIDVRIGWPDSDFDEGIGVSQGVGGFGSVKPPTLAADVTAHFQGFVLRKLMVEPRDPQFGPQFPCDVMRRGRVWIAASGDVVTDGPVFVVYETDDAAAAPLGSIRGDAGAGGITAALAPGCKIEKGASAGQTAIVNVNLP